MKPLLLKMSDFMSHGESFIDFSLLSNIVLLIGKENGSIRKSNAAGKTTVFHAIRYVLYNAKARQSIEGSIREGAKKCTVIFDFEMPNGKAYRIKRSRSKTAKEVELFEVDSVNYNKDKTKWNKISDRTDTLTDEKILDILKINQKMFENSSYFKQDEKTNLASLTPEKRKDIIKEMLHLGPWEKYRKEAAKITADYEKKVELSNSAISQFGNPENEINICDIGLSNLETQIANQTVEVDKIGNELNNKKGELNKLKDESSNEYPILISSLEKANIFLQKIEKEEAVIISNKKDKQTSIENAQKAYNSAQINLSQKQGELDQLQAIPFESVDEEKYNLCLKSLGEVKAKLINKRAEFKVVAQDLPEDEYCPTCSTPLDEAHRLEATKIKQDRLNSLATEIKDLGLGFTNATTEKNNLEKIMKDYNLYKSKIGMVEAEITKLTAIVSESASRIKIAEESIKSYDDILLEKAKSKKDAKDNVTKIKTRIDEIKYNNNDDIVKKLSNEISLLDNNLKNKKQYLNTLFENKGKFTNKLEANKRFLEQLKVEKQKKVELDKKYIISSIATSCFSSSGVQAMIIHTVLDSLQDETNNVLSILRPNIQVQFIVNKENSKGDLDETLDLKFFNDGIEFDFGDLSGGEKACVLLALKFGTAIVNRKRCHAEIYMLMLDEVDQALDAAGIDSFFDVLKEWSKYMTIMVISHNEQLKSKFDSYILVEKINKIASAKALIK